MSNTTSKKDFCLFANIFKTMVYNFEKLIRRKIYLDILFCTSINNAFDNWQKFITLLRHKIQNLLQWRLAFDIISFRRLKMKKDGTLDVSVIFIACNFPKKRQTISNVYRLIFITLALGSFDVSILRKIIKA